MKKNAGVNYGVAMSGQSRKPREINGGNGKPTSSYKPGKSDGMFAQNLLQRNFAPFGLNQFWCGDIPYIRTNLGWVYLAVVNRGKHENLVFHSDRGTQYSSLGYLTPVAYRLQKLIA